jgi:predicted kinase
MKPRVIVLVGPPLSGKDTYIKTIGFKDFEVISRDNILMEIHGTNDYNQAFKEVNPKQVDKLLNTRIKDLIDNGKEVIINMTNLTKKSRNRHLVKFDSKTYEKIAIIFPKLEIQEYLSRNDYRNKAENKYIPINVINEMIQNWEEVTVDEGFDKIINL